MKSTRTTPTRRSLYGIVACLLCLGWPAESPAQQYTLASYNIQGTSMTAARMAEVAKVVQYVNPDCVALQEVNSYTKGEGETSYTFHDWLGQLKRDGGMNYSYFLNTDKGNKNYYGIGMLTKVEPLRVTKKLIMNPGGNSDRSAGNDYGENRGLIIAEFDDYYYIGAHFSLIANYRRAMVDWIVDTIQTFTKPVFIGGDFNMTWTTTPMPYLKAGGLKNNLTGTAHTFPSTAPNKCIDFIIGQQAAAVSNLGYTLTPYAGGLIHAPNVDLGFASDHLPIYCRFSLVNVSVGTTSAPTNGYRIASVANGIAISGTKDAAQARIYDAKGALLYEGVVGKRTVAPIGKKKQVVWVEIREDNVSSVHKVWH